MATIDNTQIAAIAHRIILKKIQNQWYKKSPWFNLLWQQKEELRGGRLIAKAHWHQNIGGVATYDGGLQQITFTSTLPVKSAEFNWKYYYGQYAITDAEEIEIEGDPNKAESVFDRKAEEISNAMAYKLCTDLYSNGCDAAGAEDGIITGMQAAVSDAAPGASYNYGELNRTTYSFWRALKINKDTAGYGAGGHVNLDQSRISKMIRKVSWGMEERPKIVIAHEDVYGVLKDVLEDKIVINDPTKPSIGFDEFTIEGNVRVVWDPYMDTAGLTHDMFILTPQFFHFWTYRGFDMHMGPMQDLLPGGYLGKGRVIKWAGNLGCDMPQRQCWVTDIAT